MLGFRGGGVFGGAGGASGADDRLEWEGRREGGR